MDLSRARTSFDCYTKAYDPSNPRIALKIDHTWRVADLCRRIAAAIGLDQDECDLAYLLGLLHDIGRFEQIRRFDTFNDARSIPHAALSASVLFDECDDETHTARIRSFIEDARDDDLIRTAIETHSAFRLPSTLDARTKTFCDILRDADKIDILKVNCICSIQDIYGVSEQAMRESALSPACVDLFYQHTCLPRDIRQYPADILLGHVCFAWELVFAESLAIVREQGHLARMLSRTWTLPETQKSFDAIAQHMQDELGL